MKSIPELKDRGCPVHGPLIVDNSKSAKADELVVPGQGRPTVETS